MSIRYVALVAHNDMKPTMMAFVAIHVEFFRGCNIVTTNSTGKSLEGKLGITVGLKVASGPLGGDQEIGALISKGKVGLLHSLLRPLPLLAAVSLAAGCGFVARVQHALFSLCVCVQAAREQDTNAATGADVTDACA